MHVENPSSFVLGKWTWRCSRMWSRWCMPLHLLSASILITLDVSTVIQKNATLVKWRSKSLCVILPGFHRARCDSSESLCLKQSLTDRRYRGMQSTEILRKLSFLHNSCPTKHCAYPKSSWICLGPAAQTKTLLPRLEPTKSVQIKGFWSSVYQQIESWSSRIIRLIDNLQRLWLVTFQVRWTSRSCPGRFRFF